MTRVYFTDGTMVKENDKLFQIDPEMYEADLARAEGTVKQYEAHVERLKKEYNRARNLKDRGSISQEEHDRYKFDYEEAEANLKVANANLKLAKLNLEWTEVKSPIDGLLSRRMVDPGNLVKADDTILTSAVSLDPLYVYFDVHEQAMLRLKRLMQDGKLKIQAQGLKEVPVHIGLSDEIDFPHKGVVNFTDNRVDLNTGTLRFRARIDNPADAHGNRFIVPGLFVRVRLPIGNPHSALMVPEKALGSDQGRKVVFVLKPKTDKDGRPAKTDKGEPLYTALNRDVGNVGVLRDGYREVEKGIEPGDWVVVAGMQKLRNGGDALAERYDENGVARKAKSGDTKAEPAKGSAGHESPAAPSGAAKGPAPPRPRGYRPPPPRRTRPAVSPLPRRRRPTPAIRGGRRLSSRRARARCDPGADRLAVAAVIDRLAARDRFRRVGAAHRSDDVRGGPCPPYPPPPTPPRSESHPCSPASSSIARSSPRSCRSPSPWPAGWRCGRCRWRCTRRSRRRPSA